MRVQHGTRQGRDETKWGRRRTHPCENCQRRCNSPCNLASVESHATRTLDRTGGHDRSNKVLRATKNHDTETNKRNDANDRTSYCGARPRSHALLCDLADALCAQVLSCRTAKNTCAQTATGRKSMRYGEFTSRVTVSLTAAMRIRDHGASTRERRRTMHELCEKACRGGYR